MTISRRFWNMARSELNSLLDKAKDLDDDEDPDRVGTSTVAGDELGGYSDRELEAELERRRRARAEEQRSEPSHAETRGRGSGRGGTASAAPRTAAEPRGHEVRKAYAALELPEGSGLEAVKKAYRTLMRKYHPDRHTGSAEKQRTAHELSQRLTVAYTLLKAHLDA